MKRWRLRLVRDKAERERGNAMMEFTALGIMLLVPLVYVMLSVFEVQRGMYGVSAAAREGSRAFTLGSNLGDAQARYRQAISDALADQKIPLGEADYSYTCDPACLQAGSTVEVTVSYQVPFPLWPAILGRKPSLNVSSVHRTPFGQYRQDIG